MSHNHLRRYRKRGALSQAELAFVIGAGCGTKVSRHERATRPPSLQTALAYQAVFGVPVHELFPDEYRHAVRAVQARAAEFSRRMAGRPGDRKTRFKQGLLAAAVTGGAASPSTNHEDPKS